MEAVCDKNCFACVYPDCICDTLDMDDIKESDARDKKAGKRRYVRRAEPINAETRSEYWKVYYQENKDRINARRRERRKANPEKEKAERRRYYLAHREKNIEKAKEWNEKNKEKTKEYRAKYYQKNKERISEQRKKKRSETP